MSKQTRQAQSKFQERLLLKCKNLCPDNDTSRDLMTAAIYVLETNPIDSAGGRGDIDIELKEILPPAI